MHQSEYVSPRRRDFRVTFTLEGVDEIHTRQLGLSVKRVVHSHLNTKLFVKIGHHIDTEVHQLVDYICRNGIDACLIETLHPTRRDLVGRVGHQKILYMIGMVTDQATILSNEEEDGDDMMADELEITFLHKEVVHRRWKDRPSMRVTGKDDKIIHIAPTV